MALKMLMSNERFSLWHASLTITCLMTLSSEPELTNKADGSAFFELGLRFYLCKYTNNFLDGNQLCCKTHPNQIVRRRFNHKKAQLFNDFPYAGFLRTQSTNFTISFELINFLYFHIVPLIVPDCSAIFRYRSASFHRCHHWCQVHYYW